MPNELIIIYYFHEDLKLSIKVKMEQQDKKSVNFEEMMQKIVNAEAKVGLKSTIMIRDLDICYPQNHCLFNNIFSKIQTQGTIA